MSPPQLIPPTSRVRFPPGTEDQAKVFDTGHGPLRTLIVSNLKWGGPCRDHYVFPQADIKSSAILSIKAHCRHTVFPVHGSAERPRQGLPAHLTRGDIQRPLAIPAASSPRLTVTSLMLPLTLIYRFVKIGMFHNN